MFDSVSKYIIRAVIALSLLSIGLGAMSFTMTIFYLSEFTKHNLFNVQVCSHIKVTAYRSVKSQTDKSPYLTSIGHRTHPFGVAVSRDLLNKEVNYGDVIFIPGYGFRVVNDVMGPKEKHSIDLWVATYQEEKEVGIRKLSIIILRGNHV